MFGILIALSVRPLAAAMLVVALAAAAAAGETSGSTTSDSRADVSGLPAGEQPWWPSRYGADDQIGTLNELTADRVLAAVGVVKTGTVVGLGRVLDADAPVFPGRYWQQTVDLSPHVTNLRRADAHGQGWGENEINWITEIQAGTFQVGTQLDSIGHIQIGDRFYNGWRVRDVVEPWGLGRFGIESVPPVIGRGVLVDLPKAAGLERLPKGHVITVAEVETALAKQGVDLRAGDIVLLHTGWGGLWGQDNAMFLSGEPGPGMGLIRWLHAKRIAALGTDTWSIGPVPGEDTRRPFEVPQTMYVKFGLFGFENLATERLAERRVYQFLFANTHGRTRGSTAAVVGPAAVY